MAAEVEKMRGLIRQAMEDGVLRVSTSLHQTPGFWISTDELVEMAIYALPLQHVAERRTIRLRR
jgi:N-acyl-D-aspartate/D-glutamate deacylase